MIVCNFTVTYIDTLKNDLKDGKCPPASISELAHTFVNLSSSSEEMLTLAYLQNFLLNFIALDPNTAIVDLNDELKLYNAPKQEILRPQTGTRYAKTFTNGFNETLQKSIFAYEDLLQKQKIQGIDTAETEKMLITLRSQWPNYNDFKTIDSMMNTSIRSSMTTIQQNPKEKRIKSLEEIFTFYTKQCSVATSKKTFEDVKSETSALNIGYFLKFVKDFGINIELKKVKEMFTKIANSGKLLPFDKFLVFFPTF